MFTTDKFEVAQNAAIVSNEVLEISLDELAQVGGGDVSPFPTTGG